MEILALTVLIACVLTGFAAIFFTTFGTLIMLVGILIFACMTDFVILRLSDLIILTTLYLCGEVLEYIFVIWGAKRFGASNAAAAGALIGGIAGAFLGIGIMGVGLIPGTFLGIFAGAFLVEYTIHRDLVKSLKAGAGGLMGRAGSIAAKFIIAVIMIFIIVAKVSVYL